MHEPHSASVEACEHQPYENLVACFRKASHPVRLMDEDLAGAEREEGRGFAMVPMCWTLRRYLTWTWFEKSSLRREQLRCCWIQSPFHVASVEQVPRDLGRHQPWGPRHRPVDTSSSWRSWLITCKSIQSDTYWSRKELEYGVHDLRMRRVRS